MNTLINRLVEFLSGINELIGKRILIEYADHNYHFETIFPKKGTIISRHNAEGVKDWYLIKLDEPFQFNGRNNNLLLIRSRSMGATLNDDPSVFVLLIPDERKLNNEVINIEDFEHVVWGKTHLC